MQPFVEEGFVVLFTILMILIIITIIIIIVMYIYYKLHNALFGNNNTYPNVQYEVSSDHRINNNYRHNFRFESTSNVSTVFLQADFTDMYVENCFDSNIYVIRNETQCRRSVQMLRWQCVNHRVLGFDCEWVAGLNNPVALLQLSAFKGLTVLIRLCCMKTIPQELMDILTEPSILKVGVQPEQDAIRLKRDYNIHVNSTLDLRYLATWKGKQAEGLDKMCQRHLNIKIKSDEPIARSNWEATTLTTKQILYAANDSIAGVELFDFFFKTRSDELEYNYLESYFQPFLNRKFDN